MRPRARREPPRRMRFRMKRQTCRKIPKPSARRLREAGLSDAGRGGRNGVGSAELGYPAAALLFLALISGEPPIASLDAARLLASYRLRAFFLPLVGPAFAHLVSAEDRIDLG